VSVSLQVEGPGDAELISAVRGGDVDAYGELFARHVDAARRLARQLAGPADADDLVSDAFTKVLTVLQRGGGPDLAFRAYLLTAVRRLHVDRIRSGARLRPVDDLTPFDPGLPFQDTAVEGFENAAAARAFASLPERWQMVLWHTEVEQQKPADIAVLLGMSANSVSALAYRAREGLRQAFLSQHASDPDDVDCAWTRDHLGAYVRGGLSRRDSARVNDHLGECRACAAVYLELTEVNSGLAGLLAPLLLGAAGAGYLSSTTGGAAAAGGASSGFAAARAWASSHTALTAVGGLAVTATALFAIYGTTHLQGHGAADVGSPPAVDRPPAASTQQGNGPHQGGGHHGRTTHSGHNSPSAKVGNTGQTPAGLTSTGPSFAPSTAPTTPATGPSGGQSSQPGGPNSQPTNGPSSQPTNGPSSEPTSQPPSSHPTTGGPGGGAVQFTSTPPANPAIGGRYHVRASGGSGHIVFSIDPSTSNKSCSMHGARTVHFDHAGTCVIAARSASSRSIAFRAAAKPVLQDIVIPQDTQTVSFSTSSENSAVGGTYDVAATSSSGRPVTLSIDSKTTNSSCSLAGSTVTFNHVGSCVVAAHQDGDADLAAADATQSLKVGQGSQTIHLDPEAPSTAHVGDTYAYTAGGGASGNDVVVTTSNGDVCAVSGSSVSFLNPGTCIIQANQAGNDDYSAAPTYTKSVNVVAATTEADLSVSAEKTDDIGGLSGVTATVGNLPEGSTATLIATADGHPSFRAIGDGGACTIDDTPVDKVLECTVTPDRTSFTFAVNTQQGRTVTFVVAPTPPLTDPDLGNNVARVQWGD
jgi:RNA polymerase sigma factor (sigma-70 family)